MITTQRCIQKYTTLLTSQLQGLKYEKQTLSLVLMPPPWQVLLENMQTFITQLDSISHINLFLTELK